MKSRYALCALASTLCLLPGALAHDAWIELEHESSASWAAGVYIGHAEDRDRYALDAPRISSFFSVSAEGIRNHLSSVTDAEPGADISLEMDATGAEILALSTFRAVSELEPETFNDYVVEEGISPIMSWRAENGQLNAPGVEVYSRYLKAIATTPEDGCDMSFLSKPIGQALEIVPLTHPGDGCSETLDFELQYFGAPVEGATLHLNRTDELTDPIKMTTDSNGQASFNRPQAGVWYVHAAWAMPVDADRFEADFATMFSSLSFTLDASE